MVIIPTDNGEFSLTGSNGFFDLFSNIDDLNNNDLFNQIMRNTEKLGLDVFVSNVQFSIKKKEDILKLYNYIAPNGKLQIKSSHLLNTYNFITKNKESLGIK